MQAPQESHGTTAISIFKLLCRSPPRMEMIESRPHAHGVMPRSWKSPPHQGSENALAGSERENVALAGEKPGHCYSADPRERHQDRIRPVQRRKDGSCQERRTDATLRRGKQPIGQEGIQPHLLE